MKNMELLVSLDIVSEHFGIEEITNRAHTIVLA